MGGGGGIVFHGGIRQLFLRCLGRRRVCLGASREPSRELSHDPDGEGEAEDQAQEKKERELGHDGEGALAGTFNIERSTRNFQQ
jgi:hypothetical protein